MESCWESNNMSLEQTKIKLSECYKNSHPVLLFGDSDIDRKALIRKVHTDDEGKLEAFEKDSKYDEFMNECEIEYRKIKEEYKKEDKEYLRNHSNLHDAVMRYKGFEEESKDKKTKTNTEYRNWIKMRDKHENKINNIKEKILDELPKYIMSTNRTWKYVDCGLLKRGLDVYLELVPKKNLDVVESRIEPVPFEGSCLFDHKGTLFIDNLHCDIENKKNRDSFIKLANIIEKGKLEDKDDPLYSNKYGTLEPFLLPKKRDVSVNWLVVYVHSIDDFPECFLKLFDEENRIDIGQISETATSNKQHENKGSPLYKKTPVGAEWQDLTMAFPNHLDDKVDIHFKGKHKKTVSLKDLGFADKRATKVFKPLESLVLLKQFAENKNCEYSSQKNDERGRLHAQVESLRDVLNRCYGLDGDPVIAKEGGGYRLQFKAYCYDKKGEKLLLNNLDSYFRKLKNETNKTKSIHDDDKIKELKVMIHDAVKKILETTESFKLENVICTDCHEKIPFSLLTSDDSHVLCSECADTEPQNEYESGYVDYKDSDIPRSD